jgi:hypothetical protein
LRRPIRQPIAHGLSYCECDHLIAPRIAHKIRRALFLIDALIETSCTSGPIRVSGGHTKSCGMLGRIAELTLCFPRPERCSESRREFALLSTKRGALLS